jgi:hypothetical protein
VVGSVDWMPTVSNEEGREKDDVDTGLLPTNSPRCDCDLRSNRPLTVTHKQQLKLQDCIQCRVYSKRREGVGNNK